MHRSRLLSGIGLSIAGLGAACAPHVNPLAQPKPVEAYDTTATFQALEGAWPTTDWWTAYADPQLDALIDDALKGSPDLAIAAARVREADAQAAAARVAFRPSLDASGNMSAYRQSINQGIPDSFKDFLPHGWHDRGDAEVDGGWDLDLFGRNRATYAAATSDAVAAKIDAEAARLSLTAAVATSYAGLVQLVAERSAVQDALRIRNDSADVTGARFRQSLENQGVFMQAKARVAQAQADLDNVDGRIMLARNQLAALLGKGPDRGLTIALPTRPPLKPLQLPPSLAANLLGRRPDIVAARVRIEAASSRMTAARADFYPNISLTGQIGLQTIGLSDFFKAGSIFGQIGPAISLPIFDGGRRRAAWRGTQATYDEAVGQYDKVLVGALHEVADAIANRCELDAELAHARAALEQSDGAYRVAKLRYRAGLSRYTDVLTVEDTVVTQRRAVAALETRAFALDVVLVSALGGGFSDDAAARGEMPVSPASAPVNPAATNPTGN